MKVYAVYQNGIVGREIDGIQIDGRIYSANDIMTLESRLEAANKALEKCDRQAEAGLCFFTLSSTRAFLSEIRDVVRSVVDLK